MRVALGSNRTWFAANVRALATGRFHTAAAAVGNQSINELTDDWQVLSRMARPLFLGCTSIVLYVVVV
jgi:hypothetical protein